MIGGGLRKTSGNDKSTRQKKKGSGHLSFFKLKPEQPGA
jgi:hypothetical protein